MKKYLFGLVLVMLALTGCDSNRVFEQNVNIPENNWAISNAPEFTFEITDTTSAYNIYFNIRNTLSYEYYNLYVRHYLVGPDGKQISTGLHELYLMDRVTGEPLGKGSGDLYDHQALAMRGLKFEKVGTYTLRLKQYMRRDPLPHIMAVGVRVEKASEED